MKYHFKLVSLALLFGAILFAGKGEIKPFFLLLAISLEIYSLTQLELDWSFKFEIRDWKKFAIKRVKNSPIGKICEIASLTCLAGYFISP